jgi:23S rRNA G2069 N7-methylase RlmK/C1962 C5-methylase RlmI
MIADALPLWLSAHRLRMQQQRDGVINSTALRIVDGTADGCPGVVVDAYGAVWRVESAATSLTAKASAADIWRALPRDIGVTGVVHVVRTAAGKSDMQTAGSVAHAHVVEENGLRAVVRVADKNAVGTGLFVDQRIGRARVRAAARGATVLNLFAHAGFFSTCAAAGGAARVDTVDLGKKCAPWAALNMAMNGIDPRQHRFIVDDAMAFLRRARGKASRDGTTYGVVVCDPPTQAVVSPQNRFILADAFDELLDGCLSVLRPGGALLMSCNDRRVSVSDVQQRVADAVQRSSHRVRVLEELPLPVDVRSALAVDRPQERPMRGIWLACVGAS